MKNDFLAYKKSLCVGNAELKLNYSSTYKEPPIQQLIFEILRSNY